MILYLDTSALLKRYIREQYTSEVIEMIEQADVVGSTVLARVEMAAAFAKAVRQNLIQMQDARTAWSDFLEHWDSFARLPVTPPNLERASHFAWENGLRGYDAVHCAAAYTWQQAMVFPVTLATFDRGLWQAAAQNNMTVWPAQL